MAKAPTVYDVAQRAGVSIATVSFHERGQTDIVPSLDRIMAPAASAEYWKQRYKCPFML